jgi:hypothetical protein
MNDNSVTILVPEPHFTLFNAKREDLPEVIVVNDALLAFKHTDIFAWHLVVTLQAVDLVDQGMPSPDESKTLFDIGDKIERALVGYNAIFLARSTWNGFRQLAFRVYDPKVANTTLQALIKDEQSPPWEFKMQADPDWREAGFYFQLFPLASGNDA